MDGVFPIVSNKMDGLSSDCGNEEDDGPTSWTSTCKGKLCLNFKKLGIWKGAIYEFLRLQRLECDRSRKMWLKIFVDGHTWGGKFKQK